MLPSHSCFPSIFCKLTLPSARAKLRDFALLPATRLRLATCRQHYFAMPLVLLHSTICPFQLKYEIPVINGILTCENEDQIKNRTIFNNHGVHWGAATIAFLI